MDHEFCAVVDFAVTAEYWHRFRAIYSFLNLLDKLLGATLSQFGSIFTFRMLTIHFTDASIA